MVTERWETLTERGRKKQSRAKGEGKQAKESKKKNHNSGAEKRSPINNLTSKHRTNC